MKMIGEYIRMLRQTGKQFVFKTLWVGKSLRKTEQEEIRPCNNFSQDLFIPVSTPVYPEESNYKMLKKERDWIERLKRNRLAMATAFLVLPASFNRWSTEGVGGMEHPFHPHINPSQILSINSGEVGYTADSMNIPARIEEMRCKQERQPL